MPWRAALLPDASAVIYVDEPNGVSRFDLRSNVRTELMGPLTRGFISALAVAADGSCIALARDGDVRLCDSHSGQELQRLQGHTSQVTDVEFSEDDRCIAAGYGDGEIRVWERNTGKIIHMLARHHWPVGGVRFVDGQRRLASIGTDADDTLRLWDLESGRLLWQAAAGQSGLHSLAISPNGNLAATGGQNREIVIWNLNEHTRLQSFSGHTGTIQALQFSLDGNWLISASSDGTICVWDVASNDLLFSIDVDSIVQ